MDIRPYEQRDDEPLAALCVGNARRNSDTNPVDARLAPLLHLKSYVGLEPESCFVAYSGDVLAGYVAAVSDVRSLYRYESRNRLRREKEVLKQLAIAWSQGEASALPLIRRELRRLLDLARPASPERRLRELGVAVERYPAHCHLQVNPDFSNQGAGLKLMLRLRKHLKRSGVVGQHAIIREAAGAEGYGKMIEALGFKEVSREERIVAGNHGQRRWVHRVLVAELAAKKKATR